MLIFDGQTALELAKERIEDAVREAEQRRAVRAAQPHRSVRERLGSALVRFGQWMQD